MSLISEGKHWYSFTYTSGAEAGSTYTGYEGKGVTLKMIQDNKANAHMPVPSVLLSVCYLGYMTKEEFTEGADL
jgi:hypothetical protein